MIKPLYNHLVPWPSGNDLEVSALITFNKRSHGCPYQPNVVRSTTFACGGKHWILGTLNKTSLASPT